MILVTVRLGEPLRRAAGRYRFQVELGVGATLADLLARLEDDYPLFASAFRGDALGHRYPYRLFINSRQVPPISPADQPLADGDLVHIVLPVAGGAA